MAGDRLPAVTSVTAAVLAATCCLIPLALIAVGVAGAGLMMTMMRNEWLTLPLGVGGLAGAFVVYTRHRGISGALGRAAEAVEGNILGVTENLGVAFNSTFTALVISILIMFLMHQLQFIQERLVLDAQTYCDQRLLRHLQVRDG